MPSSSAPIDARGRALIHAEVSRVMRRLRWSSEEVREELLACARLAYLEARLRFDPGRGILFESFAAHRVRGAVYDGLSSLGEVPRRAYRRLRAEILSFELTGLAQEAREDEQRVAERARERAREIGLVYSLDRLSAQRTLRDPASCAVTRQRVALIRRALDQLSPDERTLLIAVYDLQECGDSASRHAERLGVHRSTVTRRHRQALRSFERVLTELGVQSLADLDSGEGATVAEPSSSSLPDDV